MLGDDPPSLSVGTEVSAKYKGAFCEAKIRKVVRSVKCRVTYKPQGLGTATVSDDQIKGTLRVGASVEARHVDRKEYVEATITKIQDCSQYTVVFDDGDITTLRRTALCLKSGRHFAESETLDQLPLTHPEHFGNPVIGGRRGRRSRQAQDESSEDEDSPPRGARDSSSSGGAKEGMETEPEIGRVVCVELGDKKKKDNWFPGLVVAPTAQDTVRIRVRDDYLVRSFKDARYYTVPKKEATEFTKELVNKVENSTLKVAVEKALLFLEKNELPPHWDRDSLFGHSVSSGNSDYDGELDSDSSDDEPREEKDHFVAQLYKFMDDRGTPINACPMIGSKDIDLYRLFRAVQKLGGYNRVTNQNQWKIITRRLNFSMQNSGPMHNHVKQAYKKFLHSFEDFYRKLGCTMVNHPRSSARKQRPGRSLIRDKDRNTPVPQQTTSAQVKSDKDEDEKKAVDDEKKEKKEVKKEQVKVEEEVVKPKRKDETEGTASGQESDVNVEAEAESSAPNTEKSQKPTAQTSTSALASPATGGANIATASTSRGKSKSKEDTKKKTVEKKKTETKKQEKKDEKLKEEEATKTRSKAKDDTVKNKTVSEGVGREARTPSGETEKKPPSKQRRLTDEELKKRGRKRKDNEAEKSRTDEQPAETTAPSYKGPVECGDKLKVYYGPTHESKYTYEAKVIEIEKDGPEPVYLVHYTGWNTRYDEWIKPSRIAQNFTQAQSRVKRIKGNQTPQPQTSSANLSNNAGSKSKSACGSSSGNAAGTQSRRRAQSVAPNVPSSTPSSSKDARKDDKETAQPIRSTTPLSVVSSGSRTKSPATPVNNRQTRTARNAELSGVDQRRRTRRTSGHTDVSVASESEDSEDYESDTPVELEPTKIRLRGTDERKARKEARSKPDERVKAEDTSDVEDDKDNLDEPRKGRRLRRTLGKSSQGIKSEPDSDQEEQPRGRDFDLNQIRSELKGFDKAVKLEIIRPKPEPEDEMIKLDEKETAAIPAASPKLEKTVDLPKVETVVVESKVVESTEDIYEFKEPEPFEFEVRNKRDTSSEKDKLKKRVFDDEPKSPKKKQRTLVVATPLAKETKSESVDDTRKTTKKLFSRKNDDAAAEAAATLHKLPSDKQTTPVATEPCKMCTTTSGSYNSKIQQQQQCITCDVKSFRKFTSKFTKETSSNKEPVGLNLLFNDLPSYDEASVRDDSEERLIISENEVLVEQDNVFTAYQNVQFHGGESTSATTESSKNDVTKIAKTHDDTAASLANIKSANLLEPKQSQVKSLPVGKMEQQLQDLKMLESKIIGPVLPAIVTPPAPISARLPATSTIEEKLSAAAMAFQRNKTKDKKPPDEDAPEFARKSTKETSKKLDTAVAQKSKDSDRGAPRTETAVENKEENYAIVEQDHRKEIPGDPIKQKEEEKSKKEIVESKKFMDTKVIEQKMKLQEITRERRDESWKFQIENEDHKEFQDKYSASDKKEKDRLEDHKKQHVSQDIADSTDSSDSEQRLVIDNEEPQDVTSAACNCEKLRDVLDCLQDTQDRYAAKAQMSKTLAQNAQQRQELTESTELAESMESAESKATLLTPALKTDEEGETMNSLLCEEEIPGSPTLPSESTEQANDGPSGSPPRNETTESSIVLMEMPFASAPTSGQSTTSSSTVATLSMALAKTVETSLPIPLPMQNAASLNLRQQQQQQQQLQQPHQQQHAPVLLAPQERAPTRRESNDAAPVMDNTPPTTPDSSISNISGSPREERPGGSSPTSEDIKLNRDSSEADNDSAGKGPGSSEDDTLPNSENTSADRIPKPPPKRSIEYSHTVDVQSPKKRKKNRKHSENGSGNAMTKKPGRNGRQGRYGAGSDSDDTSEGSNLCGVNSAPTAQASAITNVTDLGTYSSRSPRPTKYNFYVELDPELDGSQRIAVLQQKLTELRKTYNAVKVELAAIERRRKKLRRREREAMKAAKAEMQQACS